MRAFLSSILLPLVAAMAAAGCTTDDDGGWAELIFAFDAPPEDEVFVWASIRSDSEAGRAEQIGGPA